MREARPPIGHRSSRGRDDWAGQEGRPAGRHRPSMMAVRPYARLGIWPDADTARTASRKRTTRAIRDSDTRTPQLTSLLYPYAQVNMNADEAAAERRKARTFKKFSYRGVEVRPCSRPPRPLPCTQELTGGRLFRIHAYSSPSCSTSTRRRSPSSFTLAPVADSSAASSASRSRS